ncbi:MAG: alpha-ketoacid dehydrogenase subunit beta [Bacteroidetes bacterium]|nr:alpha-ketoacid dehydrogenase subunit beta [Verrucomicrobiota bacterium]NBU71177.1 alpha-ketoacid dehydrogenase subunit beta [Bacteroidota bacterium]
MSLPQKTSYGQALRDGFAYLLKNHPEVFTIGQGLWSPWYVGNSMTDLDREFGKERVIDTPVAELACTGVAVGAAISGKRPVIIHPRVDFAMLAVDQIVNQAAKWCHMLGGQVCVPVTIRAIINRGGEQGAQHSQSLQSWFAHIPGLRVVMPATAQDARDLLIASVLCDDPVMFIDDRWLYEQEDVLDPVREFDLRQEGPEIRRSGKDITLVSCSYSLQQCLQAAHALGERGIEAEVIDLRVLNPLERGPIIHSIRKTGRLLAVDGDWATCGMAAEVIASAVEGVEPGIWKKAPSRITLPDAPAPTSKPLEQAYYFQVKDIVQRATEMVGGKK